MVRRVRNDGRPGISSMAIAAVDVALWDLKARLLRQPLLDVLGAVRNAVPVYGSGGFTSMSLPDLCSQLAGWVDDGIPRVKMKVATAWGAHPDVDLVRVEAVRHAVGATVDLYVDANGGYARKQAVRQSAEFESLGVTWFEEPVSSDDLEGLHDVRAATTCDVAAGEYGYDSAYFERMCSAGAVDVVQADVSRCAGITEWMRVAAVAAAHGLQVSGHCAQSLHAHVACATPNLRHLEYFADHAFVDRRLFDGVLEPRGGTLVPDRASPGHGLAVRAAEAERYCEWRSCG
jgi:L-alanine-DL-glutamate epimerase-like enolase superfamily enzyme